MLATTDRRESVTELSDQPNQQLTMLLTPQGRELLDHLAAEETAPDTILRLASQLRRTYPAELVATAFAQHELRMAAREKFSRAAEMFFTRPGLEQASAELTARHRARRYPDAARLADLCCGIGGDLLALGEDGREVLAVDTNDLHLRMAVYNAGVYDAAKRVRNWQGDVRDVSLDGIDAVFVDPARRTGSQRLRAGDSEPPLPWCVALAERVPAVGIKAAPGLPHELVPAGWEIEFVADGRDLKEAVLWSPALAGAARRATILPAGHTLLPAPGADVPIAAPGRFLFDPNPAVTRAGLVEDLARELDAWKIDPQIAFLSTDTKRGTPFARTLRIEESAPWNQKQFARLLRELDIGSIDIRRRGLAGDVDAIRRRLKLRGSRRATVVLTRVNDRPWGLVCTDPDLPVASAAPGEAGPAPTEGDVPARDVTRRAGRRG
jgi:SAM-dependent methyltransferase